MLEYVAPSVHRAHTTSLVGVAHSCTNHPGSHTDVRRHTTSSFVEVRGACHWLVRHCVSLAQTRSDVRLGACFSQAASSQRVTAAHLRFVPLTQPMLSYSVRVHVEHRRTARSEVGVAGSAS